MADVRNIFSARSAPTELRSLQLGEVEAMVDVCIKCGSQEQWVTVQAPQDGHVGWALDPAQARALAAELVRVAADVETENRGRGAGDG